MITTCSLCNIENSESSDITKSNICGNCLQSLFTGKSDKLPNIIFDDLNRIEKKYFLWSL